VAPVCNTTLSVARRETSPAKLTVVTGPGCNIGEPGRTGTAAAVDDMARALWGLGLLSIAPLILSAMLNSSGPDDLKPGEWYEIPNSKLRAVLPVPKPAGSYGAITGAWSGGAYDMKRDRLVVWGGGHGDYAGNELYAFDLGKMTWNRIWGPTPNEFVPTGPAVPDDVYLDGRIIGTVSQPSFTDSGLRPETVYTYRIAAFDAAGNVSGQSRSVVIKTPKAPGETVSAAAPRDTRQVTTPPIPADVRAKAGTSTTVDLAWTASTDVAGFKVFRDGSPASRHTYDGLEYLPNIDRFWAHGGSLWSGSGGFSSATWLFDFESSTWTRRADAPGGPRIVYSAYDPLTGHMLVQRGGTLYEYDTVRDTWTRRGGHRTSLGVTGVAALDPKRRKFVVIGDGKLYAYDLTTSQPWTPKLIETSGDTDIVTGADPRGKRQRPGLEYDPVSDSLVAWHGGADVYTLNLETLVWTKHSAAASNKVVPGVAPSQGTFGRFRYVPSRNLFIAVNDINQNVYLYRLRMNRSTPPQMPSR
jgi:hypothetical protein